MSKHSTFLPTMPGRKGPLLLPLELQCHLRFTLGLHLPKELQGAIMAWKQVAETRAKKEKVLQQFKGMNQICELCQIPLRCAGKKWKVTIIPGRTCRPPSYANEECWFCARYHQYLLNGDIVANWRTHAQEYYLEEIPMYPSHASRLMKALIERGVQLFNDHSSCPTRAASRRTLLFSNATAPQLWRIYQDYLQIIIAVLKHFEVMPSVHPIDSIFDF